MAEQTEEYPCETQLNDLPFYPQQPKSTESKTDSKPSNFNSIMVGNTDDKNNPFIPRWDTQSQKPRKLRWFVATSAFPSADDAKYATAALQKAADEWNAVNIGVVFESTTDESNANFRLTYEAKPTKSNIDDEVRWDGFFPQTQPQRDLRAFPISFTPKYKPTMYNDLLHELGHILGLRHEFKAWSDGWIIDNIAAPTVEFGPANLQSVMSYTFPPKLQQSDKDSTKEFYKLANGTVLGGYKVTDFVPTLRTKSKP